MLLSYLFLREREREREREEGGTDLYAFLLLSSTLARFGVRQKNKSDCTARLHWGLRLLEDAVHADLGRPELRVA